MITIKTSSNVERLLLLLLFLLLLLLLLPLGETIAHRLQILPISIDCVNERGQSVLLPLQHLWGKFYS